MADRGLRFSFSHLTLQAAAAGQGVALASSAFLADDLATGRLVKPFGDLAVGGPYAFFIVCPEATADREKVAVFRDWAIGRSGTGRLTPRAPRDRSRLGFHEPLAQQSGFVTGVRPDYSDFVQMSPHFAPRRSMVDGLSMTVADIYSRRVHAVQQPSFPGLRPADRQGDQGSEWRRSHFVRDMGVVSRFPPLGNGLRDRQPGRLGHGDPVSQQMPSAVASSS